MRAWIASSFVILLCIISLPLSADTFTKKITWGFALDGFPLSYQRLKELQDKTGLNPQLINFYVQWQEQPSKFLSPVSTLDAIELSGATPCITWEPGYLEGDKRISIDYRNVLNHQYDDYLRQFALSIKDWRKPVIVRFGHEMNLEEYHWGVTAENFGPQSPQAYVMFFRYLVNYFQTLKVDNVIWAFCPNADSVPAKEWNMIANYYPGDDYVSILGMDGYNWGTAKTEMRSFEEIFSKAFHELKTLSPIKPVIVFETGSALDQIRWLIEAISTAQKWDLKGIVWFQVDKERNWALNPSADEARKIQSMLEIR